ncbi:MAG: hypothetical protein KF819_34200 [Labilithrix sp.]|nr:hypothetical protein [Labilithrix sp.]
MGIASERPETGVRIAIERPRDGGPPWTYAGAATLPDAAFPLRVTVSSEGVVGVELGASDEGAAAPSDLEEKIRLIVRAAYRQAASDGEPPARRIVRWRGDAK